MLDELSSEGLTFDDGRGLYPESLKAHVPLGTRVRVRRKADAEGISGRRTDPPGSVLLPQREDRRCLQDPSGCQSVSDHAG
jgi:hypothetical protein